MENTICVWDDIGMFGYELPGDGRISQLSLALQPMGPRYEFWPKRTFTGTLTLDGASIDGRSTVDSINRTKTGTPLANRRIGWAARSGDLEISFLRGFGGDFTLAPDAKLAEVVILEAEDAPLP
jgi:hypothetical protein